MLIRTESEAALNDIIERAGQAAALYREAAGLTGDAALAELFTELGRRCAELAAGLASHLRRLGDLPAAPDAERKTVAELATRVRSALAEDERLALLAERQQDEEKLLGLITVALRQELPPETAAFLRQARDGVAAARERLGAARSRVVPPP